MNELALGSVRDPNSKNKEDREQVRKTPVSNYGHTHTHTEKSNENKHIGSYYKTAMCRVL